MTIVLNLSAPGLRNSARISASNSIVVFLRTKSLRKFFTKIPCVFARTLPPPSLPTETYSKGFGYVPAIVVLPDFGLPMYMSML